LKAFERKVRHKKVHLKSRSSSDATSETNPGCVGENPST